VNNEEMAEWAALGKTLHHIDTRVTIIESEVEALAGTNRWLRGIAVVLVLQVILAAVGYGRLMEQVDQLHIDGLETNVNTALQVLGDHGTELAEVRSEQHRIRGVLDSVREEINQRTSDRFTGRDGVQLNKRLSRIEDIIYAQD